MKFAKRKNGHKVNVFFKIPCPICGRQFQPTTSTALHCSRLCRKEARKRRAVDNRGRKDGKKSNGGV